MRFNFIAVNYNGAELTLNLLRSIKALARDDGDTVITVIVDNDSSPDDRMRLEAFIGEDEETVLLPQDKNVGYFGGLNAGLAALEGEDKEHSYTIIGNNDLTFRPDFLTELKKCRPVHGVMVLAPDVVTLDGQHQNPLVRRKLPAWHKYRADLYFANYYTTQLIRTITSLVARLFPSRPRPAPSSNETEIIKLGIGACYVLTPSYFISFARLDDRVFLWGEEVLLAHQIESVGGSILYCPNLKVTHCESASVRHIQSKSRFEMVKASYRIYRDYL